MSLRSKWLYITLTIFSATVATASPVVGVTNVASTTANGSYGVGATVNVSVTFSAPVTVTGVPRLALNSGGTAIYASNNGAGTLMFRITTSLL